ncbi:S8 family serine peptidase [Psychroflexus halocasei]|uniref:Subtilase family protein n=1 Tax=Psychroflexus halocasei TaxID=908615 RepID=A0A1H4B5L6_9FLAO|nr:S8 family serine peptidase [Psychroflexus halocasei]SEA43102.1 Subtilase family protein [Psychroflexus halocasei]
MKNILICLFVLVSAVTMGQEKLLYDYYVKVAKESGINLSNYSEQTDGTLHIDTSNEVLNTFFNSHDIKAIVHPFKNSNQDHIRRIFRIRTSFDNFDLKAQDITVFESVDFFSVVNNAENIHLSEPNDYDTGNAIVNNLYRNSFSHLELIKANQAWNITTGNNSVVGVIDSNFEVTHEDLSNNILWYEQNQSGGHHGTRVSSCIAAETNNNTGIASIGYKTKLHLLKYNYSILYPTEQAFILAQNSSVNNIKVINISLKEPYHSNFEDVYQEITEDYGVTVVAASGNGTYGNNCGNHPVYGANNSYCYPASYNHVISVSSVGHVFKYGNENQWGEYNWKDVHDHKINDISQTHTHNDKVDIVAPGYSILCATENNSYGFFTGTSYASPIVAGVASLMYSANPTITPNQVKQILMDTAVDIYQIPENQPYVGLLGAGRVNAYAAVLQAKCLANPSTGLDLMMQNSDQDFGVEPDIDTDPIWDSPDIGVRNQPDGLLVQEHEDLHYVNNQTPVYVYVRVTNNSCETSLGTENLNLYWAKGGLSQFWPAVWSSGATQNNLPIGDIIGNQGIPVLTPGESTIIQFEWYPHDPEDYENNGNFTKPWMFCFLARIETFDDPMTFPEVTNVSTNTRNNNNIAYKNTTVLNVTEDISGTITAGNSFSEEARSYNFNFFTNSIRDSRIWEQAEISIELDDILWQRWQESGGESQHMIILKDGEQTLLLTRNNSQLSNVNFGENEGGLLTLKINFLAKNVDSQEKFNLHVEQYDITKDVSLGGFTYKVQRDDSRAKFLAGGLRELNNNDIILKANQINEAATYYWYDSNGILLHSGDQLTITSPIAQEYKLEIIADSDGHKDYALLNSDNLGQLTSISPNPANDQVQIDYQIQGVVSAYISITSIQTAESNNYVINLNDSNIDIDVSTYTSGSYVVALFCDGVNVETKNLIIQ